jgi:hypothetical protein
MKLPAYLVALNIGAMPVDYVWDTVSFNTYWAVTDEDNPRLANALQLVNTKAAFALGIACSEWVVGRVEGQTDISDALLRIEAGWAGAIDPRYATLPAPPASPPSAPQQFASPLRLAMKLVAYAHECCTGEGEGVRSSTQGLAMLVDHIAGRHPGYAPWLSESLRRCHEHYPASGVPVEDEPPIPQELFNPDFTWSEEGVRQSVQGLLQTLKPASNPYLRPPEEMLAAGFKGVPYGRAN